MVDALHGRGSINLDLVSSKEMKGVRGPNKLIN